MKRDRKMSPRLLIPALVGSLGGGKRDTLADIHRDFIRFTGVDVEYRSFLDRLDRDSFPSLTSAAFFQAAEHLILQALSFLPGSPFAAFTAVKIQDGSSFALHKELATAFPGRFKKTSPAAVELHATYDLFTGASDRVALSPDTDSERRYLPEANELAGCLFLADRGYPSFAYMVELEDAGANFVMRVKSGLSCLVMGRYQDGGLTDFDQPLALSTFLAKHLKKSETLDLVVQVTVEDKVRHFRFLALPTPNGHTYVMSNLHHAQFSAEEVGLAYRLRWHVELEFKAWKSYANLHRFATTSAPTAEGLIWVSLLIGLLHRFLYQATQLVGRVAASMLKTAKLSSRYVPALMQAVLDSGESLAFALKVALDDLIKFGKRAHPKRDRRSVRGRAGLTAITRLTNGGQDALLTAV